jgi:hypothetical protein
MNMGTEKEPHFSEKQQKTTLEEPQEDVCLERQRRGQYIANADNTEPPGRGRYVAGADNTESPEGMESAESDPTF